jgi:hypothetical protein
MPDLFSTDVVRENSAASITSQRHVLPENLEHAVKQLTDEDLTQLIGVALNEAKRRGKSPLGISGDPMQSSCQTKEVAQKHQRHQQIEKASHRKRVDFTEVALSPGKLNAVRAAFKAGVTPSRIARQFGISQVNVRKVLASESGDRKQ